MRVTRWFGLLLIAIVGLSGAAGASVPPDDLSPPVRTDLTPGDDVRADPPGPRLLRLAEANATLSDVVAVEEDVRTVLDEAPLPHFMISAPNSAGPSAVAYHPGDSASPDQEQDSFENASPDHQQDASDEPDQSSPESDSQGGLGSLVPDLPLPAVPVPLLEPPTVPVFEAPELAWPDKEETITPNAGPDGQVAPAAASLSPSGAEHEPVSPVVAAAVAGVAIVLVAASGTAGTSTWSAFVRPLSWLRRAVGLPLYARVAKDQVLDHGTRQELLDRLRVMPGACFAELHTASGVSLNTIRHHLRVLQANGVVTSVKNGRRRCFFALDHGMSAAARLQAAALSAPAPRRVFRAIERCPGIAQQELASALGVTPTSVAFHARRLLDAGVVRAAREGRALVYYPAA